jgi:tetratricopeptide (TPR) repeat protein
VRRSFARLGRLADGQRSGDRRPPEPHGPRDPERSRLRFAAAIGLSGVLVGASVLAAAAASDLDRAREAVDRLARAGMWPPGEVRPVLDALQTATRRFLAMPRGEAASRTGAALVSILGDLHRGLSKHIEAMRQATLDRDEDIEPLLASPAYKEREILALTALYHLSWARYRTAQLLPVAAPERRTLLGEVVRGFSEFVYVNEIPALYGDCLYGRGLAFHALGETAKAREDLEAVVELGRRNPAYERARVALEAIRRGKPIDRAKLVERTPDEIERLRDLLARHGAVTPRSVAGTERWEAQAQALALARGLAVRGQASVEGVDAALTAIPASERGAFVALLRGELASDRDQHAAAAAAYAAAVTAQDLDAEHYRSRARFGLAAACYRAGEYAKAAEAFDAFLQADPDPERLEEALYFRFKALEAIHAAAGGTAPTGNDDAYRAALAAYLDRFPNGRYAPEMRYRVVAVRRGGGDCDGALAALGAPQGGAIWDVRARFIILQCQAEATRAAWRTGAADAGARYRSALETARALATGDASGAPSATAAEHAEREQTAAESCLVAALLAATAPEPRPADVFELVSGFEKRFPGVHRLAPDAIGLRIAAAARLGRIEDARAGIDGFPKLKVDRPAWRAALRRAAAELVGEARHQADARARRELLALGQHAYATLVQPQPADGGTGEDPAATAADLAALGEIALELGDAETAAGAYARMIERDPESLEALRGAAIAAAGRGRMVEARDHWQAFFARTKPGETLWYEGALRVAELDSRLGRREQACETLASTATTTPRPSGDLAASLAELRRRICP